MMGFLLLSACFCCCVLRVFALQSWVTDPQYSLFPTLPNVSPQSPNKICSTHSRIFLSELRNKTLWAVQMWDASAKAPVGVISGSIYHFGNFDECLKTEAPFEVQFCVAYVLANISSTFWGFPLNEKVPPDASAWRFIAKSRNDVSKVPRDMLAWGLCTPASCANSDLEATLSSHLASVNTNISDETTFRVMVPEDFCTKSTDRIEFSSGEIAFWVFLFALILLTSSSTLMDLLRNTEDVKMRYFMADSKGYNIWMLFSIKQNFGHVVPLEKKATAFLDAFHGIKFFSIMFILYGHRIGMAVSLSTMNYDIIEENLLKNHKMFFVHTDLVVDTFFFISGLLACYVLMDIFNKRFVNPLYVVLVRVSRLAPLYFFLVWFQSTAAYRMGSGPLWKAIAKNETEYCVDHWWSNIFFFSNYYKTDEMCLPHSWFLPCEMHFFTLLVILIPIFVKYPTLGRTLLGIVTAISAVIPSIVIYLGKIQPLILFYYEFLTQPRKYDVFNVLYVKSHNRATVYLIGVAVGLFLHHKKDSKMRLSKKLSCFGVLAWFAFLFAPMAYGSLYYNVEKPYNALESAAFGSLRRISWAVGLSFFILTHRFGTIPLIDLFFSSRLAVFCSRITYGIYLIHFNVITTEILKTRSARVFSLHDVIVEGFGDIVKSVSITLMLIFILEIPLKRILREILFAKQVKRLLKPQQVQNVFTVRL